MAVVVTQYDWAPAEPVAGDEVSLFTYVEVETDKHIMYTVIVGMIIFCVAMLDVVIDSIMLI